MTTRKTSTSWKPGQSGNAAGRRPGQGPTAKLRAAIGQQLPEIITKLTQQALEGDTAASRLLLERTLPAWKPSEPTLPLALPVGGTAAEQSSAVVKALAEGELAPGQAAMLLTALGNLQRTVELDEMLRRIEALESSRSAPDEKP